VKLFINMMTSFRAGGLTALMAVTAGERREKEMVAKRNEPEGTGLGGVISDTRPYGCRLVTHCGRGQAAHPE
jgi:hypothetical protein